MKKTTAIRNAEKAYESAVASQFGNLHERMKYLMERIQSEGAEAFSNETWYAIWDLQTEVKGHVPIEPPVGRRDV